ncbi:CPBP family intramembrane glutamic endopeptidase [Haloarcula salinisoli]|uniref:CPBP family intramembrane metalloprotease n=1 Tax=Haloarcula salinisoli TaxID=2487746 RepID=A0A8J7YGM9_9EURY|nr:type II CAAX endopeptidase family protein [Halomicroarcula salinisoli]MBX0285828.1 CPBP family intramembrane metalloprotease [Halomicroarcula salinisoli]MBX0302679.1 CPBP family intramembrane metalloprotease [Halomicroarcula salinisoli]
MSTVSRERPRLQSAIALVSALGLGAGGLALGFALLVLTVLGIGLLTGSGLSTFGFLVLSLVLVQGIGCGGVALSYYKLRPVIAPRVRSALDIGGEGPAFGIPVSVPSLREVGIVLAGYAAAIVWVMISGILLTVLQELRGQSLNTGENAAAELGRSNPELLLLLIPASILVIGPGEELLFRGVVQARIRERFSRVPGIAIASLFFAALHIVALVGGSLVGNLVVVSILFGTATVFGVAYEYAENIVVPSLIHGLYNATLFTLLYVSLTLGDELPQQGQALLGLALP